jgi:NAD(P)-dependent dehydrogenase (short-subunit alcohol dehydrogenase family)
MLVKDLFSLDGRTVVLTGAGGFLGRTMAAGMLDAGARVVALGRSASLLELGETWSERYGEGKVATVLVDMFDNDAFETALARIAAEENVDVLVNNAHELGPRTGFNTPDGSLEAADFDQWNRNLTAGVWWAAATTKALGPGMCQRRRGSIVNVATMYANVAPSPALYEGTSFGNPPGYSAAKAGLVAFTRYTASYWGSHGVRANAILPGPFSNVGGDSDNAVPDDDPFLQRLEARTCLGRTGRAHELLGALLFLSSEASSFVTGHSLVVDGGWTVT